MKKQISFLIALIIILFLAGIVVVLNLNMQEKEEELIDDEVIAEEKEEGIKEYKEIEYFLLNNWDIIEKAEGDLNENGLNDIAIIAKNKEENSRNLFIFFKNENGFYEIVSPEDYIISSTLRVSLKIDKGYLEIETRDDFLIHKLKFRYQNNDWYLIGVTEQNIPMQGCDFYFIKDYNLLTRKIKIIGSDLKERWFDEEKELPKMEEIKIGLFNLNKYLNKDITIGSFAGGSIFNNIESIRNDFSNNWFILQEIEGDLNKNNLKDFVLIIESKILLYDTNIDPILNETPARQILVFFKNENGFYELFTLSKEALLRCNEGGRAGDPLSDIEIEDGLLILNFSGGRSAHVGWEYNYKFKYTENDMRLVGYKFSQVVYYEEGVAEPGYYLDKKEYNLLTKEIKITEREEERIEELVNFEVKELPSLKDFNPRFFSID